MTRRSELGDLWDPITELVTRALGGNTHFGYWIEPAGSEPIGAATDRLTDLVAGRLAATRGARIVDIGCGSGRPARRISAAGGARVAGVTASLAQFTAARTPAAREGQVTFHHGPVDQLCFPDGTFDGAYAVDTLLYEADRAGTVAEIARVLRPGGRLVIADICMRGPLHDRVLATATALERTFGLSRVPDMQCFRGYLEDAGMSVIGSDDIGRGVRPTYDVLAAALRNVEGFPAEATDRLAAAADTVEAFGAQPETGYVLMTAERPDLDRSGT
ncbi:class I SAM-dependent methyltransferase [Glycomyces xiaoerkulensis]|uniref:class I SAM-dependent methyltransferase n=1 Tax=Glycomyces xiaoerkulensis TaxID=2038139 RepID=UPI000C260A9B|nr:methyltransferase domain-containing protein [Glycomyces xiaoerkulensis]